MSELFGNPNAVAREIGGRFRPGTDKIVPPWKFGDVCKLLYGENADAHVAAIAKSDPRTARRWFRGEHEPPFIVVIAVMQKMFERL